MPKVSATVKRKRYVSKRRLVSETSNSDVSCSNLLLTKSETGSLSDNKSCTSPVYTGSSSDEFDDHNYSSKDGLMMNFKSCHMRPILAKLEDKSSSSADLKSQQLNENKGQLENDGSSFKNTRHSANRTSSRKSKSISIASEYTTELMHAYNKSNKNLSKNAINAKMNRLKKKQHILKLENEISSLKEKNVSLQSCIDCNSQTICSLQNEVKYLRSILVNSNELGKLLQNVCRNTNLDVISPFKNSSPIQPVDLQRLKPDNEIDILNGFEADNISGTCPLISSDFPEFSNMHSYPFNDSFKDVNLNFMDDYEPTFNNSFSDCFQFNVIEIDNIMETEARSTEGSDKMMFWDRSQLDDDITKFDFLEDAGICLHVTNKKVSLEYCASCNQSSTKHVNNADCASPCE